MPRRRRIGKARASASRSTKRRSFTNPLSCAKAQKSQVALQRLVTEISQTAGNTHPSRRLRTDPSTYDAAKKAKLGRGIVGYVEGRRRYSPIQCTPAALRQGMPQALRRRDRPAFRSIANVRFWHKADIAAGLIHVRF